MAEKPSDSSLKPVQKDTLRTEVTRRIKAVLIADKDFKETAQIRNSLEGCGYDVSAWSDVGDAREKLAARPFELVVLATNLDQKGMDDILGDLRAMRITPKVVLIADEDEGDAAARCFLRMVAVINRPLKLIDVATIVEQLIGPP
jgi:DNA-binding response OmpR family regulator